MVGDPRGRWRGGGVALVRQALHYVPQYSIGPGVDASQPGFTMTVSRIPSQRLRRFPRGLPSGASYAFSEGFSSAIPPSIWRNLEWPTLVFLAGMSAIPDEIFKAAALDPIFRRITLPSLGPSDTIDQDNRHVNED